MIKGSGDFMEGNSSLYIPTVPKLTAIDIVLMEIKLFYFLMWSYKTRDYMVMWLYG